MTIGSDIASISGAVASFGDSVATLDPASPASVVSVGAAAVGHATTAAGLVVDVGPALGAFGVSASVAAVVADASAVSAAIIGGSTTEQISAEVGLLSDVGALAANVAALVSAAAVAEGGLNPVADALAVGLTGFAALLAFAKAIVDKDLSSSPGSLGSGNGAPGTAASTIGNGNTETSPLLFDLEAVMN